MFITKATKTHRALGSKIALVSAVTLSLAAGSAALGAPAQATGSLAPAALAQDSSLFVIGHITAKTPHAVGVSAGKRLVAYPGKVFFASGGHWVQVKQERWENDQWPDSDDYLGTSYFRKYFHNGGTYNFVSTHTLKRTDFGFGDRTEEVYQRVSYRVYKNGHWSPWSKWAYSGTANILR